MKSLSLFTFGMALLTPSAVAVDYCYDDGTATLPVFMVNLGGCKHLSDTFESNLASESWTAANGNYDACKTYNCKVMACLLTADQVTNLSQDIQDDYALQTSDRSTFIESMCCDC